MRYVDYVYDIIRIDTRDFDAIYADYIISEVGTYGFNELLNHKLIESCGIVNGRQLYTLMKKEPFQEANEYDVLRSENTRLREMIMKGF